MRIQEKITFVRKILGYVFLAALVFLYGIDRAKRNNQYNISSSRLCSLNSNMKRTNTMKLLRMRKRWSIKVFNYGKGHPFPLRMKPEASRHLHSSVPTVINNLVRLHVWDNHGSVDLSYWSKNYSLPTKYSNIAHQPWTLRYSRHKRQ